MRSGTSLPEIDLSDVEVEAAQSRNAAVFRKRQLRVWLGFGSVFLGPLFIQHILDQKNDAVIIGFMFVSIIFTVFSLFLYKCPNCASQPSGASVSFTGEVSYTKGAHLFPKRCSTCGFYLSKSIFENDLEKQKH